MSTVVRTLRYCHIYGCPSRMGAASKKNRSMRLRFSISRVSVYCPALATTGVIASGRLSSSVSSVPARSVAERCLLSQ